MMNHYTQTIRNIAIAITLITVMFSCGGDKQVLRADLNLAIRLSGENCPELEKVLRHYSADKRFAEAESSEISIYRDEVLS